MTGTWAWADAARTIVTQTDERGVTHSKSIADPEIAAWLAAGNVPTGTPRADVADNLFAETALSGAGAGVKLTLYYFAAAGREIPWHGHTFDHWSVLLKGKIAIEVDDGSAPRVLADPVNDRALLRAGPRHRLIAREADSACLQIQFE